MKVLWGRKSRTSCYLLALLAPIIIAAVMESTWPFFQPNPVAPYLLAVIFTAWYGGLGPGLFTVAISFLLADFFFVAPYLSLGIPNNTDLLRLLLCAVIGSFISVMSGLMHREKRRAALNLEAAQRAEESLREKERFASQIAELSPVVINVFDLTTQRDVYISPDVVTLLGYTPQEIAEMADPLAQMWHPEDRSWASESFARLRDARDGEITEIEYRVRRRDGQWRWIASRIMPFARDAQGGMRQVISSSLDITERKEATAALRESDEYLRSILDNLAGFVGLFTLDGIILDVNRMPLERTAQRREDVIGKEFAETYSWNYAPEVSAQIRDVFRRVAQGEIVSGDFRARMAGDVIIDIFAVFAPLRDAAGTIVKAVGSGFDITDRKRAEAALRLSESRHRTLFEYAPAGILIADRDGNYIDANASICQMLGYSHEELVGLHSRDIVDPKEIQHIAPALEIINANSDHRRDWEFRRQDGSVFAAEVIATLMPDGNVMAMVRDVTERNRAETALRAREEQLRLAVAATKLGTWDSNPLTGVLRGSDRTTQLFGLPPGVDIDREKVIACVDPRDRARIVEAMRRALIPQGNGELHEEFRLVGDNGDARWVESQGRAVFEDGRATRMIGTMLDVTERKVAERKQQRSELRYRRLFESAQDGILILDADSGQIVDVNPFLIEMLGFSKEEFIGKELWEIGVFKDIAASKLAYEELQARGYIRYEDLPLKSRSGVVRQVEFVSNSYLVGDRRVIQCNIRDITDRRAAEAELRRTNERLTKALTDLQTRTHELESMTQQLWQASKLATMGELAASIAHELNNPLTTVTLSVEALMTQLAADKELTAILDTVRTESERMATLVANLLHFSRRSHAQMSTVDIAEELSTALNLIEYHLRSRNLKVVQEVAPDLLVQADRQQLLQVFLNLLTNASDAMTGGGTLTVRARPDCLNEKPAVLIEFTDTGSGITAPELEKIWDPFFTTKPEGKGTGLGLPICRRTIEDHGGTIEIESQVGAGATFRILLPAMEKVLPKK